MLPSELEELIEQAVREEWEELDLAGNDLTELPPSIGELKSLNRLTLGKSDSSRSKSLGNKLTSLPPEISELTNLQFLNLSNNNISQIPASITCLSNLEFLDLSNNNISQIPDTIEMLPKLLAIDLSNNQLTDIPQAIARLTNLKNLNLINNKITKIPESISQLSNLETLGLAGNQITEIPEEIKRLTNLCYLYLGSNKITEIPESISTLINLEFFHLSFNQIKKIPDTISQLTNLKSLDLTYNQIKEISEEITKSPIFPFLSLLGNPIVKPPLEVVEKGILAIREYFQQLQTEGVDYLYEAKLLIVGEGGAGKTSLANKIINPDYQLCEEESTKGIEVNRWQFPLNNGKTFTVNIWDFGGQEIYHATHQYFLTKRSLYLLVADTRKEDTDFYYWLNVIELFSDNSPILIVKNEKQDRQREISNQLQSEFENFKETIPTNLANNRNLEAVLTACKYYLSQLPHIGQTLPKTWIKVRHALERDPRNFISLDEYLKICKDNGFTERKTALQLSDYLHDLGICLHFQDDDTSSLSKIIILKPKWGTDAAYAVLDNKKVICKFGQFTRQDLTQIWNSDEYVGMHGELLELMKKFQLCYEIPQSKGNYIAPQLLSENQTAYTWDDTDNLILRYTYDFMPKGMLRQLIVTMHQHIDKDQAQNQIVWRSGVIINCKTISNTRAEVIENYNKREIKIRISGKNKKELLATITYELDKIHNSYKRLTDKYQKLIPCNCSTCKGSQNPHFYKFANLKRRRKNHKYTIECDISYQDVNILNLIDYIGERSILYDWFEDEDNRLDNQLSNLPSVNIYINQMQEQSMSNQQLSFGGDYVHGDKVGHEIISIQINSPNLAQAAREIKEILDQLSEEYNFNTKKGQNLIKEEAINIIKKDSTLRQKILNALKEGSITALENAINHPAAKILIATTKDLLDG
jgi:small GTP-binding protein